MKKALGLSASAMLALALLVGCGAQSTSEEKVEEKVDQSVEIEQTSTSGGSYSYEVNPEDYEPIAPHQG
ncbi:hypothetical protein ACJ2A9_23180, partial [Anaerobacillus sp. MEB173]